jgi:hypothetical protein
MSDLTKDPKFEEVVEYLLRKNAELYRRLARGVPPRAGSPLPDDAAVAPDHAVNVRPDETQNSGERLMERLPYPKLLFSIGGKTIPRMPSFFPIRGLTSPARRGWILSLGILA